MGWKDNRLRQLGPNPDICKMNILLTAATAQEIAPAMDFIGSRPGLGAGSPVGILITGVGIAAATYRLTLAIKQHKPDIILQAGIAGGFGSFEPGMVVAVAEDLFADLGVWEQGEFKSIFDMQLADRDEFPFTKGILSNPNPDLLRVTALQPVRAITVNEISTSAEKIAWYQQNLSPVVESMEGAAFHYVCLQCKIPFLQIRSVSNRVGERDKTRWRIADSIRSLNEALALIIQNLLRKDETKSGV